MNALVHIGIAVDNLDTAMLSVGAQLGLTWATPQLRRLSAFWCGRPFEAEIWVTWSREGPPHVELVCGGSGTPWETGHGDVLHHLAYWTDDLAVEVERLRRDGCELELTGAAASGAPSTFAYVRRPAGLRIELMDRAVMEATFDGWLAGGSLPGAVG
jgi:Glyoxalase/Bleomycin resistance protein/Dioxygenase superfamily